VTVAQTKAARRKIKNDRRYRKRVAPANLDKVPKGKKK